jgi:hypothetical protein
MTVEATIAKIESLAEVASVNVWNGKRAYINLTAADRSFAGCRSHQLYIDMQTGALVDQMGKGTTPRAFDEQRAIVTAAIQ